MRISGDLDEGDREGEWGDWDEGREKMYWDYYSDIGL